jgi:acyl-CoA synthetase (AMP-forming)/AMP-acid ligase II
MFTSGTTAQSRRVVISHGNVLASIEPVEREILRQLERNGRPEQFSDVLLRKTARALIAASPVFRDLPRAGALIGAPGSSVLL